MILIITAGTNYNSASVSYTLTVKDPYNGYAYVDLGLPSGTKWAKYNVGSSSEGGFGNYYKPGAGATAGDGASIYSGYENPLPLAYDTARQVMGGAWHTPTQTQCQELINNTTLSITTINGNKGAKLTANNGNYVFIPFSGEWPVGGSIRNVGSYGNVWTSTLYKPDRLEDYYQLYAYSTTGSRTGITASGHASSDTKLAVRGVVG